ncbi:hypothetical protein DV736_g6321, partial [Chaetothyriales sp. CBS 134916]
MPTLKSLSCQIRWSDTDGPFQEYGTQYGDGVVETYVVVPDKPQRFYIRLTSKGFVHEGLAAIVFMDGTYQCNRNRVNLIPAKNGRPRERSEIDFIMRQKEKTIGEGLYIGRQWRFDNHNIVPDPPKKSEGDHFKFFGTIEVVVLRCCARSVDDSGASDISSAAESQILETALRGRADSPVDRHNMISPVTRPGKGKGGETEDDPLGGLFGLFDGAADPPTPRYHYHERPPARHEYGGHGCHRGHQHGDHASSIPFFPPPAPRPSGPAKRVHFDYGPSHSHLQPQTTPLTPGWVDNCSDVLPEYPNLSNYTNSYQCNTPGLKEYQHTSQHYPLHPPPQPVHHNLPVPSHGSSASWDVPCPGGLHSHNPPAPPPPPFRIPANHLHAIPDSHPAYPVHPAHPLQPPQDTASLPYIAGIAPQPLPLPDTPVPCHHMYPPPYWPPPQYRYPPPGQKVHDLVSHRKPSSSTVSSKSGRHSSNASSLGLTKDKNYPSNDWGNHIAGEGDIRDDCQYQNPNDSEAQDWSNEMARGRAEEQRNYNLQSPDGAGEISSANQDSHQGSEMNNTTANGNSYNGADDSNRENCCLIDGLQFGGVDGTAQSGTNPTDNDPANVASTIRSSSRPLHGPHGTYFAMQSPAALDAPCDAEEEPRYDVPQSYVDSCGSTKQVQPGKGYLYTKKRYSPNYIDDLNDPYARFVFIYRTKEQLKKDINLTLDEEPTGDEEIQKLQNVPKDELIQMLLRAQDALGGTIPSPLAPGVAGSSTRVGDFFEPVTFEPPDAAHLDYHIPEQRAAFGTASDAVGRGSLGDAASARNTGGACINPSGATPGNLKQQSWETSNAGHSETPVVQAGNDPTDNQGIPWSNDYRIPTQNEDHNSRQIREAVENDRNSDLGQRVSWQSNRTSSEENLNHRDGSKCSTQSSRRGHDASPDREFSAPLIAEETEEPTQQLKGSQKPPPRPLPTSHGRWVLTSQGWLWQLPAFPRPQLPTYFGYGPHTPFYGTPPGHRYQQYPSVRPGPVPQRVNLNQSPPQMSKSPASGTPDRRSRKEHVASPNAECQAAERENVEE